MIPQFPSNTRDTIEQIIHSIGRPVTFHVVATTSGCYLCSLDPITETSTDSFCPICGGSYWIPTYTGIMYSGKISWGSEQKDWSTGGYIDVGDCLVTIMHDAAAERTVFSSEFVTVDGRELNTKKVIIRGVPEINRILVTLKEKERE
jgi:hypothetical protein